MVRFPKPLQTGDVVGVTSPSSGVAERHRARLAVALDAVRARGYEVRVGECMDGATHVSAPAEQRAAELEAMLLDPSVRAIVPPWGGETAIDIVDLVDWDAVAAAEPTWVVGYSDLSTIITPMTLLTGIATIHGQNLMDTPYRPAPGLAHWLDIIAMAPGTSFEQTSPGGYRPGFVDYVRHPEVDEFVLTHEGSWTRLDDVSGGDLDVTGRLIGGCIETLCNLAGTPFLDTARLPGPKIVYVEAAGDEAATICRNLHGLRLNGFFDDAVAIVVGRTSAPDHETLTQHEAVIDALGRLGLPILADVECGHVAPYLPLVNGATARVEHSATRSAITQTLA